MAKKPQSTASPLRQEVAALYEVRENLPASFVSNEFGPVDLTKIDLQLAEQLADKGYLLKKGS